MKKTEQNKTKQNNIPTSSLLHSPQSATSASPSPFSHTYIHTYIHQGLGRGECCRRSDSSNDAVSNLQAPVPGCMVRFGFFRGFSHCGATRDLRRLALAAALIYQTPHQLLIINPLASKQTNKQASKQLSEYSVRQGGISTIKSIVPIPHTGTSSFSSLTTTAQVGF